MKQKLQIYAINIQSGWTVLLVPIPCGAGQGETLAENLTEKEMKKFIRKHGNLIKFD